MFKFNILKELLLCKDTFLVYNLFMETKEELLKELRKLIKDVPEEGLIFLIEQANKLVYNKRVEEINAMQAKLNKKSGKKTETQKKQAVKRCSISIERGSL